MVAELGVVRRRSRLHQMNPFLIADLDTEELYREIVPWVFLVVIVGGLGWLTALAIRHERSLPVFEQAPEATEPLSWPERIALLFFGWMVMATFLIAFRYSSDGYRKKASECMLGSLISLIFLCAIIWIAYSLR